MIPINPSQRSGFWYTLALAQVQEQVAEKNPVYYAKLFKTRYFFCSV